MLKITNRSAFDVQIRNWTKGVRGAAEGVTKGLAMVMLKHILQHGPQYTGDFVANWNVSIGSPDYSFNGTNPNTLYGGRYEKTRAPHKEGDPEAINKALSSVPPMTGFKLGQTIWLANGAFHDESYAMLIEEERITFRPENPSGGRLVMKALQMVNSRYNRIGLAQAMALSKV